MEFFGYSVLRSSQLEQLRSIAAGAQHLHLRLQEMERLKNEQLDQLRRHLDWILRTSGSPQVYLSFPDDPAPVLPAPPTSPTQSFQQLQEEFLQELASLEKRVNHD